MYKAAINVPNKVYPSGKFGYKLRNLYLQFVGTSIDYELRIANGFNYFYYEDKKKDLFDAVRPMILKNCSIKEIVFRIEEKFGEYFKEEIKNVERGKKLTSIISKDIECEKIPFPEG